MPPTRPESCTTIAYYDRDDRLSCVLPSPALLGSRVQRSSTETITPRPGRHDEPSALPTSCVAAANGRFAAITDWSVTVGPGCRGPHGALKLPAFAATPRERGPVGEVVRLSAGTVTLQAAVDAFFEHHDLAPSTRRGYRAALIGGPAAQQPPRPRRLAARQARDGPTTTLACLRRRWRLGSLLEARWSIPAVATPSWSRSLSRLQQAALQHAPDRRPHRGLLAGPWQSAGLSGSRACDAPVKGRTWVASRALSRRRRRGCGGRRRRRSWTGVAGGPADGNPSG